MTDTSNTPAEQFRDLVTETLKDRTIKQADRIDLIIGEFERWIEAHQSGTAVEIVGGRVVVQTVEQFDLRIGLDATGRATRIETIDTELTWST
jgi:hypothetical protein